VADLLAPLTGRFPTVRWMSPELLHLTLVFLGQTDAARVADLERALVGVAQRHVPYEAQTGAAGGRVDDRPGARRGGVAWLRLRRGANETARLALDVDEALGSATYDGRRRPRPHLTVARNASPEALAALGDAAASLDMSWTVERIVLFRSHTGPRGSRYEELASLPLTRGPERA
jgi:2'-5' RNA ligase